MNKTADYEFTIIVPVFNEEDNLQRLEERLSAFLPGSSRKACVLFVDDGSKDGSLSGIKDICSRHQDFFYISFEKNAGLSAALKAGFRLLTDIRWLLGYGLEEKTHGSRKPSQR